MRVLQEDFGVRYNPARIYDPNTRDSRGLFIHGMAGLGQGGTCASMLVLYVAIGHLGGGPSVDQNGDGVPDECQDPCDVNPSKWTPSNPPPPKGPPVEQ